MKKLGTLAVLFAVGLFSVAPMVGCGGEEDAADDKKDTTTEPKGDDAGSGDKEDAK